MATIPLDHLPTPSHPAWRSDLILRARSGAEVEEHPEHLVVRTRANPTFHWGNLIILRRAPRAGEVDRWRGAFRAAFPEAEHESYGFDVAPAPDLMADLMVEWEAGGLELAADTLLTATRMTPGEAPPGVEVRPLAGEDDWRRRLEADLLDAGDTPGGQLFLRRRWAAEKALAEDALAAGTGAWWGAFADGDLLGSLGLFDVGGGEARYQQVYTRPDARRRGVASALVRAAGARALDAPGVQRLLIVAETEGPAIGLYRRCGLSDTAPVWAAAAQPANQERNAAES